MNIEDLIVGQQNKIYGEYHGGYKHGHDLNILKAILEYNEDKSLVDILVEGLEDKALAAKVKLWMAA